MVTRIRIATWNLENLDDQSGGDSTLNQRISILRPQLLRLRADVLVLQEVNGQEQTGQPRQLLALQELLTNTPYAGFSIASTKTSQNVPFDVRNLVVVSRFPILGVQQRKDATLAPSYKKVTASPAETARPVEWERPILHVRLDVGGGRTLHVVNLHLKSKLPSDVNGQKLDQYTWKTASGWAEGYFLSSMKRVGQALETRMLVDQIFDAEAGAWLAVAGDFNAESDEVPVLAIRGPVEETNNPALATRVLVPCENTIPESARYTLFHLGKGAMLDHLLVSRSLLAHYRGAEIHNEVLPDESGAFRTDEKFPESDHAPVVAEFEVP
jgi:endonuclease/exonuclease/phosphatase family metal-dependent hydrolase